MEGYVRREGRLLEVIPFLLLTGGLGFSLQEIGISLTIAGMLMLPLALFAFPLVILPVFVYYHNSTRMFDVAGEEARVHQDLLCGGSVPDFLAADGP